MNPRDGVRIHIDADGPEDSAAAVLFLHGAGLTGASWRGLGYVRALRGDYRTLCIDLRGHGQSSKPHDDASYRMVRFVDDVRAVLDLMQISRCHVVGYSFGARVALELALDHPEQVCSATLIGGSPASLGGQVGTTFFPEYQAALRGGGMRAFIDGWEARRHAPLDNSTRTVLSQNDPLALSAFFAQGEREPGITDQMLARCEPPVQWLTGTLDVPRFEQTRHAAAVMGARFTPLHRRTHSATLFPAEPIIEQVTGFIHNR